jgi:hypothetical protein
VVELAKSCRKKADPNAQNLYDKTMMEISCMKEILQDQVPILEKVQWSTEEQNALKRLESATSCFLQFCQSARDTAIHPSAALSTGIPGMLDLKSLSLKPISYDLALDFIQYPSTAKCPSETPLDSSSPSSSLKPALSSLFSKLWFK